MSFINSVAKSMNGIKTIETSELIFTDDNSTLNTSAGITQAQSTGQTAINKSISAVGFNTGSGVLTLTTQGTGVADLTQNLDGRYITSSSGFVTTSGTQNIAGVKTFTDQPKASGTIDTDQHLITRGFANGEYVKDTGTGQIDGAKTFTTFPIKSGTGTALNPSADNQLTTKKYVDDITDANTTLANANYNGVTISGQNLTFSRPSTSNPTTIAIPGGTGDVTKAGTNAFTGTNTFNTNRPTSTLTTTALPPHPNANEFITKRDGDTLYQPVGGRVRVFQSPVKFASAGTPASPTNGTLLWARPSDRRNDQFPTMKPSSGADSLELSLLTTGYFTATSYDVGVWNFQLNLNIYPAFSTAVSVRFYHFFGSGASYQQDKGIYFTDSHSAWLQLCSSCMLDMALGDSMYVYVTGIGSIAPGASYTNLSGTFLG